MSDEEDGSATEEEEEEELDEDLLLEDQEEEIDVDAEVEEPEDDEMELVDPVLSLIVSWSGRGSPSEVILVKGSGSSSLSLFPHFDLLSSSYLSKLLLISPFVRLRHHPSPRQTLPRTQWNETHLVQRSNGSHLQQDPKQEQDGR